MESAESTLHCSFVVSDSGNALEMQSFKDNVTAFFKPFPIVYEIVYTSTKESTSRSENLRLSCSKAQAPLIIILDPALPTPLGDIFKILQTLLSEPSIDFCWGERLSKNDSPLHLGKTPRLSQELTFNKIQQERKGLKNFDFYCECGGFRKASWEKISHSLQSKKLKNWYFFSQLLDSIQIHQLKVERVYIRDSGATPSNYSKTKALWQLLAQSIF